MMWGGYTILFRFCFNWEQRHPYFFLALRILVESTHHNTTICTYTLVTDIYNTYALAQDDLGHDDVGFYGAGRTALSHAHA